MRKLFGITLFFLGLAVSSHVYALLSLELTHGVAGAIPIAIVPFATEGEMPQDIAGIVSNDLQNSGRFKVFSRNNLSSFPTNVHDVQASYFRHLGTGNVVIGKVQALGSNRYQISFQLLDIYKGSDTVQPGILINQKLVVPAGQLRMLAHHISDLIYQQILGVRGVFSTRLAYVVVQRTVTPTKYVLEVADQDGYNPKPLLTSTDPIMSPSWSPNGKQIAYVSFENRRASIYIEDITTGARHLVSSFPGINGAPAWAPDGRRLAVVLSKNGTPNIYTLDLATHNLTQITNDWSINTEPAWSPDGRSIIFTSNRGGGPQIYKVNSTGGTAVRLTYDGNYNARGSYTHDGNHIVALHQESGVFNVGILDLDTGTFHILTTGGSDNDSPTIAPNGSMVLYGTYFNGHSMLAMVSSDGGVQLRLPVRNGDVQDPAWSPFLS